MSGGEDVLLRRRYAGQQDRTIGDSLPVCRRGPYRGHQPRRRLSRRQVRACRQQGR